MNAVCKLFLSMSVSGSVLILALLAGKRLWKDRLSRQWQYYIWLAVILRLLVPFAPEVSLLGAAYQAADRVVAQSVLPSGEPVLPEGELNRPEVPAPSAAPDGPEDGGREADGPVETLPANRPLQDAFSLLASYAGLLWLAAALGLLIRKITVYQGFARYVRAGAVPVSDMELLDRLAVTAEQAGVKRPVELCVNPLISSPLLIGFLRPCIVLPSEDIPGQNFRYIVLHELIHYKRRDMFYKWLVQVTVCLHWFNPLAHLMSREITRACEFSCDEAVLTKMGCDNARDYGKTLLDAMAAVGKYKENLGAVTLSENKQLLKERLGAIMNFRRKPAAIRLLTGVLTLCVMFGAAFVGVYPAAVAAEQTPDKPPISDRPSGQDTLSTQGKANTHSGRYSAMAKKYYEAGSLPLFGIAFSRLDESAQKAWLEKLYADGDIAFFSVAVRGLDTSSCLLADCAEKSYADGEIAFFSTLTDCMNEMELESWLDRALEDGKWNFQSMLFDKLERGDEFDEQKEKLEKEWAEAQVAEYQAAGVTMDGKNYYYQGQLVNIFLDVRANKSFYTLDINSNGTVNIKISRNEDGKIETVRYMTDAEAEELLRDMEDLDEEFPEMETLNIRGTTYYLVTNEAQLRAIGTGEYGMDRNYLQQADIHLSAKEWAPIGTWEEPFTGTFNGNGFEITGLTMTDPDATIIGLFGVAKNARIYNVTLRDYDIIRAGGNSAGKSVGAVLAVGQGSRSYDNVLYPKAADGD